MCLSFSTALLRQPSNILLSKPVKLRTWERDGHPVVPLFSSLLRLQASLDAQATYLAVNALELLRITKGANLILNPGAAYGKEFTAAEVASILDGSLWKPTASHTVAKPTKVMIGQPSNYPHELVAALGRYFQTKPGVRRAYLALYVDPERDTNGHTLIAIEMIGDWNDVASGAGLVGANVVIPNPPIDFMQITGKAGIEDHFRASVKPFYEKSQQGG
jgi:hypothetical protein